MNNFHTPNKHYPLPHPDNLLQQDVIRISDAISQIDENIWQQEQSNLSQQEKLAEQLRRLKMNTLLGESLLQV